jgi:1-phosphofructokinase
MIYTVTLNPAIDYIVRIPHIEIGAVNRMASDEKFAGGKGINVSRVLARLKMQSTATGFLGGFTGSFIEQTLDEERIQTEFTHIAADTRINVKLKSEDETEINGQGPAITDAEATEFLQNLEQLTSEDIVVLAGSAPQTLGQVFYEKILEKISQAGASVVCDFEGEMLLTSLQSKPLLVKPNNHELGAIYNVELTTVEEIIPYAKKLLVAGARHVIISMAGDGALLVTNDGNYFAPPIKGVVKNSVGAGDSMVAGFTGKFGETRDAVEAFKWGVACGTATTFSDDLATGEYILEMLEKVRIEKI